MSYGTASGVLFVEAKDSHFMFTPTTEGKMLLIEFYFTDHWLEL